MLKSYVNPEENREANQKLPKLMVEGLLLGGTGLGVLALIFEIAADAFSVAAYQTLLAIHGANGYHEIAIAAFVVLSVLLFFWSCARLPGWRLLAPQRRRQWPPGRSHWPGKNALALLGRYQPLFFGRNFDHHH